MQKVLSNSDNNQVLTWVFLAGFAFIYGIIASILTVYLGPGATGSGIAEIMALNNGVNYPGFNGFGNLFTKIFGVVLAISASLCVGKEGPLAHIGAIVSSMVIYYVPINKFKYF
jgi:H+/Cl- antiporter ClcA